MKKRNKRLKSPSILKWNETDRRNALEFVVKTFDELKNINFRDNITIQEIFEKNIFDCYFHDKNDFKTFRILIERNRPMLRKEIFALTKLKRTTQYYALEKLLQKGIIIRKEKRTIKQGRPQAFFQMKNGFRDKFLESFRRYSQEYMCPQCKGSKEKIYCKDNIERIICTNLYCPEDKEYIDKKIDELCKHGIVWDMCDECRIGFLFKKV